MPEQPQKKKSGRSGKPLLKRDHEHFSAVDVIEQIVILVGFLALLAGFWYVVIRLFQVLFSKGG